jgi:DNA excision repair protein ERCC-2
VQRALTVSAGELAQFTRRGDIHFRFSGRSSAMEGIRGHQTVQGDRGAAYRPERPLSLTVHYDDCAVTVQGRADGVDEASSPALVEEIKTLRVAVTDIPDDVNHLHWQQLRVYGHLLAMETAAATVSLRLCYYNLDTREEVFQEQVVDAGVLQDAFLDMLDPFVQWLRLQYGWQAERDLDIAAMAFPYGEFRPGQRDMSVAVFRNISQQNQVILQAPTGIGKTMGALFPAIKGLVGDSCDRVFYISAKTSGQIAAERAIADIQQDTSLRHVTITARDKVCFNPGSPCDPDYCSYAKGYYDRIRPAVQAVLASDRHINRETVEARAEEFHVCPFELSLDLSTAADVVICDYNYVFDPTVYLRRFFDDGNRQKHVLLVDESHNLVDRGRDMFSSVILKSGFHRLKKAIAEQQPLMTRRLNAINRQFLALRKAAIDEFDHNDFVYFDSIPSAIRHSLAGFCEAAEDFLKLNEVVAFQEELLTCYFDSLRFLRTCEQYNDSYACFLKRQDKDMQLHLYCVDPSSQLQKGFERMSSSVCFSATLQPRGYYKTLMGIDDEADWYSLPSPFLPDNVCVSIASFIKTSYRARADSVPDVVSLIIDVVRRRKGNYLVFFPSYRYLDMVYQEIHEADFQLIRQQRAMDDAAREDFLARFSASNADTLVGFAVMGGVFAEGIDLKGERLIGAIVVGVGLPQIGIERNLIRDHFGDQGFEFAYQYPGMNRVLQTSGRVIRDDSDRGIVVLVDQRFAESRYRELLPDHWQVAETPSHSALVERIESFW